METLTNPYSRPEENNAPLWKRLYIYQKERFPLAGHGLLVAAFSFSAVAYSRICRGKDGFVSWKVFLAGVFTTVSLFLLVRIFDEFKDAKEDALYRRELPVPRGLVSFRELRNIGIIVVCLQVGLNAVVFPKMLLLYALALGYLLLMSKEFFVADWLKRHQFWYVVSHMLIIPLIDIYASGLDWMLEGVRAPGGLLYFFAVSFMSGIVLEIGRKIRAPEQESEGVLTYSAMLGPAGSAVLWIGMLSLSLLLSILASAYAGYGTTGTIILSVIYLVCCTPALLYLKHKSRRAGKMIEGASAAWTIAMYLTLGGVPMIERLLNV